MNVIEKHIKTALEKIGIHQHIPKSHAVAASTLLAALIGVTLLPSSDKADAKRHAQIIEIPQIDTISDLVIAEDFSHQNFELKQNITQKTETVRKGDTLSAIFKRVGLSDKHMMKLLHGSQESKKLAALYPGHKIEFSINDMNELVSLNYIKDRLNSFSFSKVEKGYNYKKLVKTPDIHFATVAGKIENSLYDAGLNAKLDDRLIMELADIFGWDIDFALDIRKGDTFKVVFEEKFLDGEKIGNGAILAAEFINQKEVFQAVRYKHANGNISYYTPDGKSMRKAFLRAPLDFRRISSNFNPKRLHPIFKTIRPHRGIDYAADRGTPVWSSGNGRVIASGYTKANGNYVVIQHGNTIQTKYLHLHKRFVKKGQKVKQKQKIGTVGSTGYATAPHLHYEFLISGIHRNPRTILNKLPKAKSIPNSELHAFQQDTQTYLAELNAFSNVKFASANSD